MHQKLVAFVLIQSNHWLTDWLTATMKSGVTSLRCAAANAGREETHQPWSWTWNPFDSTNERREVNNSIVKIVHCITRNNNIIPMLSNNSPRVGRRQLHTRSRRVWISVGSTPDLQQQQQHPARRRHIILARERLLCCWSVFFSLFNIWMNQAFQQTHGPIAIIAPVWCTVCSNLKNLSVKKW